MFRPIHAIERYHHPSYLTQTSISTSRPRGGSGTLGRLGEGANRNISMFDCGQGVDTVEASITGKGD